MTNGVTPDRAEALRYLGYRGQPIDEKLCTLLRECEALTSKMITPRSVYRKFPIVFGENGITVCGTSLTLPGESIREHLSGCSACVLFAATIGLDIERTIRHYTRYDLTRGAILDAFATAAIEAAADEAETTLRKMTAEQGLTLNRRFSPGYGDLPITLQPEILGILNASRQIGLSCTESGTLTPCKSITAVMGISAEDRGVKTGCGSCSMANHCQFRKDGGNIEHY